jgi:hypothetical protein
MAMNMDFFEKERTPEDIERRKKAAAFLNELSEAVESGRISLDEGARQLALRPTWSGTFADARRFLAPGPRKSVFP